jgi:hypothetical protein
MRWEIGGKDGWEEKGDWIDKIRYCVRPSRACSLLWSFGFGFIHLHEWHALAGIWHVVIFGVDWRT